MRPRRALIAATAAPAAAVVGAFFIFPLARLALAGATGVEGPRAYLTILTAPRYLHSLGVTLALSAAVTLTTLFIAGIAGVFLARSRFPGRALLVGTLTLPLAFPGVVVGFLVIMLGGRLGLAAALTHGWREPLVFAYSLLGLFVGYCYFSIPRVILTVIAAVEHLDRSLEEAASSLGATPLYVAISVVIPGLAPALVAAGALVFATSMGAFGTAFTLGTELDVLPVVIYSRFTEGAEVVAPAVLSLVLAVVTWAVLSVARRFGGLAAPLG